MKSYKFVFKCALVFFIILIPVAFYVHGLIKEMIPMMYRNHDLSNQYKIAEAVVEFLKKNGKYPDNIEALVDGGFLPQESYIYASPYDKPRKTQLRYDQTSYYLLHPDRVKGGARSYIQRKIENRDLFAEDGYFEINALIEAELKKHPNY